MDSFFQTKVENAADWLQDAIDNEIFFVCQTGDSIHHWVETDRFLTDTRQYFHVFIWNYQQLRKGIDMYFSGQVKNVLDNGTSEKNEIKINGYTMNYVSSGIDLVNLVDSYLKHERNAFGFNDYEEFEKLKQDEHADNLLYALAYAMRNFSQHGNLLVSCELTDTDLKIGFDLHQLLNSHNSNLKKCTKERFEALSNKLFLFDSWRPYISYPNVIESLYVSVCKLYLGFLKIAKKHIEKISTEAVKYVEENNTLCPVDPNGNKAIIYILEEEPGNLHFIEGSPDNLKTCMKGLIEEAEKHCLEAEKNLEEVKTHFRPVACPTNDSEI